MISSRSRGGRTIAVLALVAVTSAIAPVSAAQNEGRDIRIVRDNFGVPHVFAATETDASYGVGYSLAQDRLWQMHIFRLIAKGQLSEFVGPLGLAIDREVRFFTYTEDERAARYKTYPADIRANLEAFVDGINAWIAKVRSDPRLLPFEFVEYGEGARLRDWTVDDSLALQDVLILAFGSGGGNEITHAALLSELMEVLGDKKGRAAFDDLVMTTDPDTPVSIPRGYKFSSIPTRARTADVAPRRRLEDDARLGFATPATDDARRVRGARGTAAQMALVPDPDAALDGLTEHLDGLAALNTMFTFGSNAQIVGPSMSETGNSGQTGGPQVGYLLPQWLADFGIHGGDFDATGMTFAGAGPAVLIGRGRGYAWTTTTGASDLTDTFVEQLNPDNPRQYRFRGEWQDMACREESYTFHGLEIESQEICRTVHGPVVAFDEANNVAYSLRYSWFNREGQTIEGFFRYQEAKNIEDYATFANYLSSNHNMFYTDDRGNMAYWHPGNHVVRAPGVDIRLPQDGRGGSEWRGLLPIDRVPHAVNIDRGWIANWNNQPSWGWQRERAHPALDNVLDLEAALDPAGPTLPDPAGGRVNRDGRVDFEDLSANLRYAAMKDHTHTYFERFLPAPGALDSDTARKALAVVNKWDGFNVDDDGNGMYDSAGRTILDRWVSSMQASAFADDLGDSSRWASQSLLWHVLAPDDAVRLRYDWLGNSTPQKLASDAFEAAVAELAAEFESDDPATWVEPARMEHYQRLNADLVTDALQTATGLDASGDRGWPGDVRDHIEMDRGTYNHVVVYSGSPGTGPLGHSRAEAGSVIPPGQSGHIGIDGREAPHYEDQLELYENWTYKPMPMTLKEALAVKESEETLTRP